MLKKRYKLSDQELGELRVMHQLIKQEEFKYGLVKGNTAMVYRGKEWADMQGGVVTLMKQALDQKINEIALGQKIEGKVTVDLEGGILKQV